MPQQIRARKVADSTRVACEMPHPPAAPHLPLRLRPEKSGSGLVSRVTPVHTALRNCTRDEGRPFGFGDQVADPKPPQAAVVKSDGGERCSQRWDQSQRVRLREASASEPSMKCRNAIRRCQNRGLALPPGSARGNPEACPSGIRHVDGAKLNQALVRNLRTCRSDAKGEVSSG